MGRPPESSCRLTDDARELRHLTARDWEKTCRQLLPTRPFNANSALSIMPARRGPVKRISHFDTIKWKCLHLINESEQRSCAFFEVPINPFNPLCILNHHRQEALSGTFFWQLSKAKRRKKKRRLKPLLAIIAGKRRLKIYLQLSPDTTGDTCEWNTSYVLATLVYAFNPDDEWPCSSLPLLFYLARDELAGCRRNRNPYRQF